MAAQMKRRPGRTSGRLSTRLRRPLSLSAKLGRTTSGGCQPRMVRASGPTLMGRIGILFWNNEFKDFRSLPNMGSGNIYVPKGGWQAATADVIELIGQSVLSAYQACRAERDRMPRCKAA